MECEHGGGFADVEDDETSTRATMRMTLTISCCRTGKLRYANNSQYKNAQMIRKEVRLWIWSCVVRFFACDTFALAFVTRRRFCCRSQVMVIVVSRAVASLGSVVVLLCLLHASVAA